MIHVLQGNHPPNWLLVKESWCFAEIFAYPTDMFQTAESSHRSRDQARSPSDSSTGAASSREVRIGNATSHVINLVVSPSLFYKSWDDGALKELEHVVHPKTKSRGLLHHCESGKMKFTPTLQTKCNIFIHVGLSEHEVPKSIHWSIIDHHPNQKCSCWRSTPFSEKPENMFLASGGYIFIHIYD